MIAVVLAGGYAKRLWPLTLNKPKALLPLAHKLMIDYVLEKLLSLNPPLHRIVISTNLRFQPQFQEWLKARDYKGLELVPDNSLSQETKPGAVTALSKIVEKAGEDVLVLAGDNLFTNGLHGFLRFFNERNAPTVALYHARNKEEAAKGATVIVDEERRIVEFVEKTVNPKTTLVGACVYAFPAGIDTKLRKYLRTGLPTDEPGRFIQWLHKQESVYGYMLQDYLWDIGTIEMYAAADKSFSHAEASKREHGKTALGQKGVVCA